MVPLRGNRPNSFAARVLAASTKRCRSRRAALHAVSVEQVHALLDARNAVGNLRERVFAQKFLRRIERAMIGADGVDEAGLPARPRELVDCAVRAAEAT